MKVSIIIPCFNQAQYLEEALSSAVCQQYPDFEVIAVNDGSTDETGLILQAWPQIKVATQSNKGLAGARNAGVLNSSGELLVMLDADDWLEADFLAKTVPLMTDGVGVVCPAATPFGYKIASGEIWHAQWPTLETIKQRNMLFYCSLIRRQAFLETGGYNPRMALGYEDWNLWIDIIKRGWATAIVNEPLLHYRVKERSMFTEARQHHEELVAEIHRLHPELYGAA